MKGVEVVHGTTLHEQWDCNSSINGYSSVSPVLHNLSSETASNLSHHHQFELAEWMEHVAKHLCEEAGSKDTDQSDPILLPLEDNIIAANTNIIATDHHHHCRPRKIPRRHLANYNGDDHQHEPITNWNHSLVLNIANHQTNICDSNHGNIKDHEHGLNLISLLLECAVAISVDNLSEAHRMLLELTQMASPYGPSCAERVVAYFAMAMSGRVMNTWLGICSPLIISHKSIHNAFQLYNNISPFIKFAHFTSNQAILEAFHQRDKVHIIDLDIMQGLQWPALFHILATRLEGTPHVRMTGVGTCMDLLVETGRQLSNFTKRLGISFEFHPIAKKFGEIERSMVQVRRGEAVAVHWLQHSLYDTSGPDWKTMRLIQQISPRVITLVEQDITHGGGSFLDRFVGSLHYYSTVFDSLGASLSFEDPSRHRVEHGLLYREINNILAIGGPVRSGEEKLMNKWGCELGRHGFVQVPMSSNSMAQAQLILNMFPPTHGYSLMQGDGTLKLGWKETSLYTASAWTSSQ